MIAGKTYRRRGRWDRVVKVCWADERSAIVEDLTHGTRFLISCSFYDHWREELPIIKRSVYMNVYPKAVMGGFTTRKGADLASTSDRVGCIRVDLEFEEGRLDE